MLFNREIIGESCAVNAILGGIMAQEIIKVFSNGFFQSSYISDSLIFIVDFWKVLSKKNEPIDNFFLFDGDKMSGIIETVGYPSALST